MTISKRLQLLVLAAVLGLVLVAGMSWYQIEKVYSAANVSSASCMPGMVQLRNANIALSKIRIYIWVHISFDDAAKKEEVDKNIAGYQNDFDAALNAYEKNYIKDDKDRALLAIDRAEFAKYSINLNKIRELSSAHRKDEAFAMAMTIPTKAVAGAITSHFDYNVDVGAKADKEAQEVKAMALRMAIGIALASILAVFFVGFAVYRQINSGLRNAQHTITSIGSSLDFTLRADVKGRDEISQTLAVFNQLIERLQTNLRALQTGVREVAQTSGELLGASQQVAESSTTQSESSAHMAASVEQMTVSINHVAERAGEASHLSSAAGQSAQSGQQVIGQTVEDIHAIAQAVEAVAHDLHALEANSKEIETVVNVVRDVADQTNLLALNAAIEAARAGESGRGFAVVADEVRKLAERTTASTQEISAMIVAIQAASGTAVGRMREAVQRVEQGVARAGSAEQSMSAIFGSSSQSVRLVSEISDAIREQGGATNTIASQVESVAQMAEENSSAASQAAAMAQRLEEVSTNMHAIVAAYRLA